MSIGLRFYDGTFATFAQWAETFCRNHPRYQQKGGAVSMFHLMGAANAEGFTEINAANIADVQAALERRAEAKRAE